MLTNKQAQGIVADMWAMTAGLSASLGAYYVAFVLVLIAIYSGYRASHMD